MQAKFTTINNNKSQILWLIGVGPNTGNPCSTNPCSNGGSCLIVPGGGFSCRCPAEFTGSRCETPTGTAFNFWLISKLISSFIIQQQQQQQQHRLYVREICARMEEHVNRTVLIHSDVFVVLDLQAPFVKLSQVCTIYLENLSSISSVQLWNNNIRLGSSGSNACTTNRCLNGGTCQIVGSSSFRCVCRSGYSGTFCESFTGKW